MADIPLEPPITDTKGPPAPPGRLNTAPPLPRRSNQTTIVWAFESARQRYLDFERFLSPDGTIGNMRRFCVRLVLLVGIPAMAGALILFVLGVLLSALLTLLKLIVTVVATIGVIILAIALIVAVLNR